MKFNTVFFVLLSLLLTACSSSSIVMLGQPRDSISPEQVKLYTQAPKKFEQIALIEGSSKNSMATGDQAKMNRAIEVLREQAADLGANGIILQGIGSENGAFINTTNNTNNSFSTGVSVPIRHKNASGIAIYVFEE